MTTTSRLYFSVVAVVLLAIPWHARGQEPPTAELFAALLELDTPGYTGGMTAQHQVLAEAIWLSMSPRFDGACETVDPWADDYFEVEPRRGPLPGLAGVDADLVLLIRTLDDPSQEVRDVAAYTIGLLGPAASDAVPFLEAKYLDESLKGGWFGVALERVICELVEEPAYRRVVPDELDTRSTFESPTSAIARLYLSTDAEFPPWMLGGYRTDAADLLRQIVTTESLSDQKRAEALCALSSAGPLPVGPIHETLRGLVDAIHADLRDCTGDALFHLEDPLAVPILAARIQPDDWSGRWDEELCSFGPDAIAAGDRLAGLVQTSDWPRVVNKAVDVLGCIQSARYVPLLTEMLGRPDWTLAEHAALALGAIGQPLPAPIDALRGAAAGHWSERVRDAATEALIALGVVAPLPERVEDDGPLIFSTGSLPIDHGLPWCDDSGRYSIDGRNWFFVDWIESGYQEVPLGFPQDSVWIQSIGAQAFLRVSDGWLFGSNGFESEGVFAHVGNDGTVTEWERPYWRETPWGNASIENIVQVGNRILAFGYEVLKIDEGGALFEISQDDRGVWSTERTTVLPSGPRWYAIAPNDELLLSDGPNAYAVINRRVVPLQCEIEFDEGYFAR